MGENYSVLCPCFGEHLLIRMACQPEFFNVLRVPALLTQDFRRLHAQAFIHKEAGLLAKLSGKFLHAFVWRLNYPTPPPDPLPSRTIAQVISTLPEFLPYITEGDRA